MDARDPYFVGKRYRVEDRDEFHRDLRAHPRLTISNARKTSGVLESHDDCPTCRELLIDVLMGGLC